uniref:Germin-like protein n=1 Tax=Ananas comosus var. bracteatus TaxID=296719 RepID=A0A6V7NIE4_ANACO|nr:unnamed protein product [Ananas comosus var. bracteatus]
MPKPFLSHPLLAVAAPLTALAGDPDIVSNFLLPQNLTASNITGAFFTFTGMRQIMNANEPTTFTVLKATAAEFPALNGQSVSSAVLIYPRALDVGFVDTTDKLYTQTLQPGDLFVFPKGLVHFQYNRGSESALAVSAFGSANAGTVSVPAAVFGTGIDDWILAKSFKTDVATIQEIKAGLTPKAQDLR